VVSLGVHSKSQSHLQKIRNILQHTDLQSCMKCERDSGHFLSSDAASNTLQLPADSQGVQCRTSVTWPLLTERVVPYRSRKSNLYRVQIHDQICSLRESMCFLMLFLALDTYLAPLRILSFFVNVSLTSVLHRKSDFVHIYRD
jgi:hypothetical protein